MNCINGFNMMDQVEGTSCGCGRRPRPGVGGTSCGCQTGSSCNCSGSISNFLLWRILQKLDELYDLLEDRLPDD